MAVSACSEKTNILILDNFYLFLMSLINVNTCTNLPAWKIMGRVTANIIKDVLGAQNCFKQFISRQPVNSDILILN